MTGAVEVDYDELLDADGTVVGYVDPDGIAHEFPHVEGGPDHYPYEAAREHGKVRTRGDAILIPESALFLLEDAVDSPAVDPDEGRSGVLLSDDVDGIVDDGAAVDDEDAPGGDEDGRVDEADAVDVGGND